jgi:hypothetical protein
MLGFQALRIHYMELKEVLHELHLEIPLQENPLHGVESVPVPTLAI